MNKNILDKIKQLILSWFNDVENEAEYVDSRKGIDAYIDANMDKLGPHHVEIVLKIIESISTNQKYCLHHVFRGNTTSNFISDGVPLSNHQYMAVKEMSVPLTSDKVTNDMVDILNYNLTHGPRVAVESFSEKSISSFPLATQVQSDSQRNLTSFQVKKSM